jgi:hypothetical protein
VRVLSKIVPAVADVSRRQSAQSHLPPERRQPFVLAHLGQTNPSGHRRRSRYSMQLRSSGNHRTNAAQVLG